VILMSGGREEGRSVKIGRGTKNFGIELNSTVLEGVSAVAISREVCQHAMFLISNWVVAIRSHPPKHPACVVPCAQRKEAALGRTLQLEMDMRRDHFPCNPAPQI
jgi:hypothetical protein